MADRNRNASGEGREGFGDDAGTRVGRPDEGRAAAGPSQDAGTPSQGKSTGAGGEAAEGIHGAGTSSRNESDRTSVDSKETGREDRGTRELAGSEPLQKRNQEHKGSYGGEGGTPRTSSDTREKPEDGI